MSVTAPLRIHFITEDDPLYVAEFFRTFLSVYEPEEIDIAGITIQAPFNESPLSTARRVLSLYGPTDFARLLARLVRLKLQRRSVAHIARNASIPLEPAASVNDGDFVERMRSLAPDVIVSVAAPEIFREEILAVPRFGCINVHSGRLPTYRGMMPTFWQMRSGERHVTVTVHAMVAALDAGSILGTTECLIEQNDSLDRVMRKGKQEGAHLLIRVLRELSAGTIEPQELDMTGASYFSFPRRTDLAAFGEQGYRLL